MSRSARSLAVCVLSFWLVACSEGLAPELDHEDVLNPSFAKGGRGGGNKPPDAEPKRVRIPLEVRAATDNHLEPDGPGPYDHEVCGVKAVYEPGGDFFVFRPVDNALTRKQERDLGRSCSDFPRTVVWRLDKAIVHLGGGLDGHDEDVSLPAYITDFQGADTLTVDDQKLSSAKSGLAGIGPDESLLQGRGFNLPYCLDDGRGRPFRFNPDSAPGSNRLELSRSQSGDVFTVRTQAHPNNVGACEHGRDDGSVVLLLLHADVAYTVEPPPLS